MWTYVLADIPSFLYKWIGIVVKILFLKFWLVKQQKEIPVRIFMVVATCPRAIQIEYTAFGQYVTRHLLYAFYDLCLFHTKIATRGQR